LTSRFKKHSNIGVKVFCQGLVVFGCAGKFLGFGSSNVGVSDGEPMNAAGKLFLIIGKLRRQTNPRNISANNPSQRRSGEHATRSSRGSLWVEAAFSTPVLATALVGTAEVGSFYLQRVSIATFAHSVAMTIQQNPNITAQELYEFQKTLGGGGTPFKEVKKSDGSSYSGTTSCSMTDCKVDGLSVKALSGVAPVTRSSVVEVSESDWSNPRVGKLSVRNSSWPNSTSPWATDPAQDTADDGNPYYVGVLVEWTAKPISTLMRSTPMFGSAGVKQFAGTSVRPLPTPVPTPASFSASVPYAFGAQRENDYRYGTIVSDITGRTSLTATLTYYWSQGGSVRQGIYLKDSKNNTVASKDGYGQSGTVSLSASLNSAETYSIVVDAGSSLGHTYAVLTAWGTLEYTVQ
jgi:hypothetical protein